MPKTTSGSSPGSKAAARPGLRIDDVKSMPPPPNAPGWVNVLKAFNPLGPMAESWANTLAYRIESKRLAIEMERIREQAAIANNLIDKSFQLKMEELEHRRLFINGYFKTVREQLAHLHIERMKFLEMMETAQRQTMAPGIPMEERRLYKEILVELAQSQPRFAEQANQSLEALIKALPPVALPPGLLVDNSGDAPILLDE